MTRAQFGFAVAFASALVWATAGFLIMVGVLLAGVFGWAVVGLIDGQWNTDGVRSWLSRSRKSSSKY
jgi:hypothetical protein